MTKKNKIIVNNGVVFEDIEKNFYYGVEDDMTFYVYGIISTNFENLQKMNTGYKYLPVDVVTDEMISTGFINMDRLKI